MNGNPSDMFFTDYGMRILLAIDEGHTEVAKIVTLLDGTGTHIKKILDMLREGDLVGRDDEHRCHIYYTTKKGEVVAEHIREMWKVLGVKKW